MENEKLICHSEEQHIHPSFRKENPAPAKESHEIEKPSQAEVYIQFINHHILG